tara:strand:+ start:6396 stop:6644 length:249 start_codon:yes stop_codon:yes gene_type:complete
MTTIKRLVIDGSKPDGERATEDTVVLTVKAEEAIAARIEKVTAEQAADAARLETIKPSTVGGVVALREELTAIQEFLTEKFG